MEIFPKVVAVAAEEDSHPEEDIFEAGNPAVVVRSENTVVANIPAAVHLESHIDLTVSIGRWARCPTRRRLRECSLLGPTNLLIGTKA